MAIPEPGNALPCFGNVISKCWTELPNPGMALRENVWRRQAHVTTMSDLAGGVIDHIVGAKITLSRNDAVKVSRRERFCRDRC